MSTEKSTIEIDADLAQNDMQLYLITSRQLNLCYMGNVVKWHTNNDTYVKFPSVFRETVILNNFYKIHDEKCSFLSFSTTRVKLNIWNQRISVNVHVA